MPFKTRGRGGRGRPKKRQLAIEQDAPHLDTESNQQPSATSSLTPTTTPSSAKYKPREERSYKDFYPDLNINQALLVIRQPETDLSSAQPNGTPSTKAPSPSTTSETPLVDLAISSTSFSIPDETAAATTDANSAFSSVTGNGDTEQQTASTTTSTAGALWKESLSEPTQQNDTYPALSSQLQVHHTTESGAVDLNALPKPKFKLVTDDMETTSTPKEKRKRHSSNRRNSHQADDMDGNGASSESDTSDNNDDDLEISNSTAPLTDAKPGDYSRPENHYIRYTEPTEEALFDMVEYDMDEQDEAWLTMINKERQKENLGQVSCSFFENVIDKLEKEWFDLVKHLPKQAETGATLPEDSTCAICEDGECENSNAIVFCDGCNLAVHQDCYGVPYIPEGQWLCRKCMVSPDKPVSCLFCPNEGGAFKQTNTNKWGHLLCAIWIPEIGISNGIYMEPIDNIDSIPKSRWKLTCYICKKRNGACIQCDNKHCFTAFHVTCARWARLCMRMKSHSTHYDSVQLKAYCDRHTPRDYREEVDVERCVLAAQKFFDPKSQRNQGRLRFNYTSQQRHVDEMSLDDYTDDDADGEHDSDDDDSDIFDQQRHAGSSTSKSLKRKGKQRHRGIKKRKTYSITGSQQLTPSLKAARAHQHHYSAGAPIAPNYILTKLEHCKNVRQATQLRKKSELIASICRYWSLKRESRRGAPLLKRLHLEPWTASSSQFKKNEFDMAQRAEAMMILRSDLERVRMLSEQVQKREKLKLESLRRQKEYIEMVLFPVEYIVKPVLNQLMEMDKKEFFLYPVTPDVAPDYRDVIDNPMAFSDIIEKIHNHEYATIDAVENDLSLIWTNSKAYNKMDTPYYRLANRMEGEATKLLNQAREEYNMLNISPQSGTLEVGVDADLFSYAYAELLLQTTATASILAHEKQPDLVDVSNQINPASESLTSATTTKERQIGGSRQKKITLAPTQVKRSSRLSGAAPMDVDLDEIPPTTRKARKFTRSATEPIPTRKSKRAASAASAAAPPPPPPPPPQTTKTPVINGIPSTTETCANTESTAAKTAAAFETVFGGAKATTKDSTQKDLEKESSTLKLSQSRDAKSLPLTPSSSSSLGSSLSSAPSTTSSSPSSPSSPSLSSPSPSRRITRSAGPSDLTSLFKSSTKNKKISHEIKSLQLDTLAMESVRSPKAIRKSSTLRAPRGYQYLSSDDNDESESENDNDGQRNGNRKSASAQQVNNKRASSSASIGEARTRRQRFPRIEVETPPSRSISINRPRRVLPDISVSPPPSRISNKLQQKSSSGTPTRTTKAVSQPPKKKLYKAKPGEIVWARVPGFPYHPAEVIDLKRTDISKHILQNRTGEGNVLVKFYKVPENHQWGWIKPANIFKFGNSEDDTAMLEHASMPQRKKKSRYAEVKAAYDYVCKLKKKSQKT
ncbi:unnamed protein product [Absidia cylindrospora]